MSIIDPANKAVAPAIPSRPTRVEERPMLTPAPTARPGLPTRPRRAFWWPYQTTSQAKVLEGPAHGLKRRLALVAELQAAESRLRGLRDGLVRLLGSLRGCGAYCVSIDHPPRGGPWGRAKPDSREPEWSFEWRGS